MSVCLLWRCEKDSYQSIDMLHFQQPHMDDNYWGAGEFSSQFPQFHTYVTDFQSVSNIKTSYHLMQERIVFMKKKGFRRTRAQWMSHCPPARCPRNCLKMTSLHPKPLRLQQSTAGLHWTLTHIIQTTDRRRTAQTWTFTTRGTRSSSVSAPEEPRMTRYESSQRATIMYRTIKWLLTFTALSVKTQSLCYVLV